MPKPKNANWQFLQVYQSSRDALRESVSAFTELVSDLRDDADNLGIYFHDIPNLIDRAAGHAALIASMSDAADEVIGSKPYTACDKTLKTIQAFFNQKEEMLSRKLPPVKEGFADEGVFFRILAFPENMESVHAMNRLAGEYKKALAFVGLKYGKLKEEFETDSRNLPVPYSEYRERSAAYYEALSKPLSEQERVGLTIATFPGLAPFAPKIV